MAIVVLVVKLLPDAPQSDLEAMKQAARAALEPEGARNISFEERPFAFGLKALVMKLNLPEDKGTDIVESLLSKIPHVSSVTIEDYRRALG